MLMLMLMSWLSSLAHKRLLCFCEDEFSFVFVEAPTNFSYNSLKALGCSGEDVLAVKFSSRFLENHKGVGMFQNCLQNENSDIFPRSTLG